MKDFDEIKQYLPKYLSPEATESLFEDLKAFTDKPHDRLYSGVLGSDEQVLQGDGLSYMPISNLPESIIGAGPVIVLSNTCEIDSNNVRALTARITYCPIVKLSKFVETLEKKSVEKAIIDDTVDSIKRQRTLSIIFLPKAGLLLEDYIALLDRPNNCGIEAVPSVKDSPDRLFSLSNFGWYLFLFKISLHFTRIQEAIHRA